MRINTLLTLSVLLILSVSLKAQDYTYTETQDSLRTFNDGTLVVKEGILFYRYCINNSITVKSCIIDNMNNDIYIANK